MSRTFINGGLAERARLATQLLSELLAELPDEVLTPHQKNLSNASRSLLEIQHDLRRQDTEHD